MIVISLIFSAFFSGMEIAFVSSNKLKVELDKKSGSLSARIFSNFIQNPSDFITAMLVGNNVALVIYGISFAYLFEPMIISVLGDNNVVVLLVQTLVSTLIILVTAEFLPKALFRINPNRTLNIFSVPTFLLYYFLFPLVKVTNLLANAFMKKFLKVNISEGKLAFGRVDLDNYVKEATADKERLEDLENEVQIFQNALDFTKTKARECMVPRTELVAVDENESIDKLKETFHNTGLSKILIYRDDIDHIIGYVHSNELFRKPDQMKEVIIPIPVIPESMPANEILAALNRQKKSIALVLDEFGGTSGIVTVEDILEEIVGDIEDEHDQEEYIETQIADGQFMFSARLEIDYINEHYDLKLPESEDYTTLAGLIYHFHENIPELHEKIELDHYIIEVIASSENKVDTVKVTEFGS